MDKAGNSYSSETKYTSLSFGTGTTLCTCYICTQTVLIYYLIHFKSCLCCTDETRSKSETDISVYCLWFVEWHSNLPSTFIKKSGKHNGIFIQQTYGMHKCNEWNTVRCHIQTITGKLWMTGTMMAALHLQHF